MERQLEAYLLVLLDEIIEQRKGQWQTKEKVKCLDTDPLIQKMQQEKQSNNALQRHIQALKRLASNPSHLQFPNESEDNPKKWEVYRDGHRELPKDIEGEIEEEDQGDKDDDQDNENKGQEEEEEGDEDEDWNEAEKKQEDDNEDHPDLVTTTHKTTIAIWQSAYRII